MPLMAVSSPSSSLMLLLLLSVAAPTVSSEVPAADDATAASPAPAAAAAAAAVEDEEGLESAAAHKLLVSAIALSSDLNGAISAATPADCEATAVREGLGCSSRSRGPEVLMLLLPGREAPLDDDGEDGRPLAETGRPLADLGRPLAELGRAPLRPLLLLLLPGRVPPVAAEVGRA